MARKVKTDQRTFILDPMRRIERSVHAELEALLLSLGYEGVRIPHLNVFAHVPRPDGMRMSVLAERMQLTQGAVTQLVAHLERLRLVKRIPDPTDGRGVVVVPTARASRGYDASRDRLDDLQRAWTGRVGAKRWKTFVDVLNEIAEYQESSR
jgi:DNA-binding MarR family transcriptional regulator